MNIENVTVVGAGIMGRGIAHVCALGGFNVKLNDVSEALLQNSINTISANMQKGVDRKKLTPEQKSEAEANMSVTTNLGEAVENADLVIEAIPEDLQLKQKIFKSIEASCPSHTILATNTSSMSVTEICAVISEPGRTIGLHFFNPVHIMKLVEIICGLETTEETLVACEAACQRMGKETVRINEFPGFVTTRINAMIGNEAFTMLQEGLGSPEDIDKAIKLGLNHPMGPFEMVDLVGLDTRLKIMEYLHQTLGEKYRPAPLLSKYVKAGRIGRKVGRGVYEYGNKK
ncbi:3-hydroxybutyryl-CoA dehydrogenase [Desulfosarcina alkanivorans]|jgi:3-hydroxybutyryl-CoA dehydrogenase|uniref:3-hydroxybutyryl-CoA dehydrogenase n=1 Tax=Desulfosarcina alkanivorans TaxID=571177 RepID=A0A5K7YZ23_9BACT|nr:3-hydroxyacyl-CoA dehydrogenase NAD-binding domain-containing protein [Desulfosarcina alkanivorans]BBO69857.1 3-hydroxybutyryl-CoA dehydrogenase [Desulfosarcina alkanivorans]